MWIVAEGNVNRHLMRGTVPRRSRCSRPMKMECIMDEANAVRYRRYLSRVAEMRHVFLLTGEDVPFSVSQVEQVLTDYQDSYREYYGRRSDMAAKAKKDTAWKGFANVAFNAEARAIYENWSLSSEALTQRVEDLTAEGYRITLTYDKANQASQCSFTCQNERSANNGYTLTARGPSWWDALTVAIFKHDVLTGGEWPLSEKTTGDKWG